MRTAKYCLELQGKCLEQLYECDHCHKQFSQKIDNVRHMKRCTVGDLALIKKQSEKYKTICQKQKIEIRSLTKNLKQLEEELSKLKEELAHERGMLKGMENARPIINNNTQIIQKLKLVPTDLVKPFPQAVIEDGHETYTYDHFLNTRHGLVDHLLDITVFEDESGQVHKNYVCTNRAKNSFHVWICDEKWKRDHGAYYIHKYIDSLQNHVIEYTKKFDAEYNTASKNPNIDRNEGVFRIAIDMVNFKPSVLNDHNDPDRKRLLKYIRSSIRDRLSI
jgi:outer membrane lipoprotein-sorting protein